MLHPDTKLDLVDATVGLGIFATKPIPRGTIIYVQDPLEIEISPDDPRLDHPALSRIIERYSYITPNGTRIISWDLAKYMNHSCSPNTISTGYGFEIAIRDIDAGEEITDDYGLFNVDQDMVCCCQSEECRSLITREDIDLYHRRWDKIVRQALARINKVSQPLYDYVDSATQTHLENYLKQKTGYIGVRSLKHAPDLSAIHYNDLKAPEAAD